MTLDTRVNRFLLAGASSALALVIGGIVWWLVVGRTPPTIGDPFSFYDAYGRPVSGQRGRLALVMDPWTVYRNWPNQTTPDFTIDAEGFRATPRRPGRPHIFILGGSAAFGWQQPSDQKTFPWLLGDLFADYDVVNTGVIGFQSGQELSMMVHRADRPRVAAYVTFDGFNDLLDQFLEEYPRQRPPDLLGVNNTFWLIGGRLHEYYHSLDARGARQRVELRSFPTLSEEDYIRRIADAYLVNVEKMHAFALARGAKFLVVLQPDLGHRSPLSARENAFLAKWEEAKGYLRHRFPARYERFVTYAQAGCRERGIVCLNVQSDPDFKSPAGDSLFVDPVHLSEHGHAVVATLIERRLRALLSASPS